MTDAKIEEVRELLRSGVGNYCGHAWPDDVPLPDECPECEKMVNELLAPLLALVEQRVAQTAAEILLIIKGSRMIGQSPIGRLHQVGWNAAVSLISDRVRAIIADPNWLAKHDAELERLTRLDEAKLWEQSYSDALYVYGPGDVRLNIERWRDFKLVRIAELGGGPKNDPHS